MSNSDEAMSEFIRTALLNDPGASLYSVTTSWRAHRGLPIWQDEADRFRANWQYIKVLGGGDGQTRYSISLSPDRLVLSPAPDVVVRERRARVKAVLGISAGFAGSLFLGGGLLVWYFAGGPPWSPVHAIAAFVSAALAGWLRAQVAAISEGRIGGPTYTMDRATGDLREDSNRNHRIVCGLSQIEKVSATRAGDVRLTIRGEGSLLDGHDVPVLSFHSGYSLQLGVSYAESTVFAVEVAKFLGVPRVTSGDPSH